MRKFSLIAASLAIGNLLLAPDSAAGAGNPEDSKPEPGANSNDAQMRNTISELRNHVKLLTKNNRELEAENNRLQQIIDAIPAAARPQTGKLAELIQEKRLAGLNAEQAEECARRQMAHDEEMERQAEAAKPKAAKPKAPEAPKAPEGKPADKPADGKPAGK